MRYDLAFFLCCCKSFLHSSTMDMQDYYDLLGVHKDATQEDIKKAYKRQSLQMHPDKLVQRGMQVTQADQLRFTKMKEAYEVLSDPHKRETYNAIGEKGMKWLEEPFSIDPQEMAQNFAHSSWVDRSKIFAIFVAMGLAIFLLPVLICLQADGRFGDSTTWIEVLTPCGLSTCS
jgi:DnaJ-class molecular chaperone